MTVLSERTSTQIPSRSRGLKYVPVTALATDLVIVTASALLAYVGRQRLPVFDSASGLEERLGVLGPLVILGWVVALVMAGSYSASVMNAGVDEYKRVLHASLVAAGLIGVGCYVVKFQLSRGFFVLLFGLGIPALVLGRLALRRAIHRARRRGALRYRVVIAGSASHVDEVASVLRRESWLGYHVVGALTPPTDTREETDSGIPVLGNAEEAASVQQLVEADVIFFAGGAVSSARELRQIAWDLEHEDVQVVVAPSVTDVSGERIRVRPVGGLPLMHIDPPRSTDASRWGKRLFDIVGSLCLILAFSPVFLLASLRIKRFDRGPVLFRQTRVGKDGQTFACLKFRTMVVDAESLVTKLQAEVGQSALLFKLKDDPRITPPGRWLRRYSVDELPQLFNVLRGEMSLIGPRPQVPLEVALYDNAMSRRLRVRPGMTGLWQVSGRNDLSAEEAIRLDLYYVDNWSMVQDLSILAKTAGAVFGTRGAY
jgi:exopolysaccharide biosynthesis polyprenyl glycosylphosphotransferase